MTASPAAAALRVAVVAEWYPSVADPVHGIWAHRQAVATQAAGAEVQVLALRRPVPPLSIARRLTRVPPDAGALGEWARGARAALAPATRDGLVVHSVPWLGPPRPLSYPMWGWWMAPSLRQALDRLSAAWPFDVLHAHTLAPAGHAAARWIRWRQRSRAGAAPAFAVSGHGPDLYSLPDGSAVGRHAVRTALHTADVTIANSSWTAARCAELAGRPVATAVVHLGATVGGGAGGAGGVDAGGAGRHDRLTLVTVAHLQERKHHHVVLGALARLPAAIRPDYVIVGDGERRPALEERVLRLGLGDRVRFLGQLANEEAVAVVAGCDLFVMPGVQEPFGVAFVEAMAAGVPAIGARGEGGPRDIAAAGEGMLLVDADDEAGLAGRLRELHDDRVQLRALGEAARATALTHFTWERCGQATVAAYRQALAARRDPGD